MKKIIFIMTLALAPAFVHAQGWLAIYGPAANITTNTGTFPGDPVSISGKMLAPAGTFDFALLYATSTTAGDASPLGADWNVVTLNGGGQLLGNNFPNDPGGITGPSSANGVQVNLAVGITYDVMLVGWSPDLGSSWSTISTELPKGFPEQTRPDFFGQTGIGTLTPFSAAGAGVPAMFPTTFPIGSMVLYNVAPEPTTLALAGLGGLSMLFLRRRKA